MLSKRKKVQNTLNIRKFDLTLDSSQTNQIGVRVSKGEDISYQNCSVEKPNHDDSENTMNASHFRQSSLPSNLLPANSQPYEMLSNTNEDEYVVKYEDLELIGEGAAAVVRKCRHRQEDKFYATKVMRNRDLEKEIACLAEFDLLKGLEEHPNIIKAKEFISTERWIYMVLEYAEGRELQDYMEAHKDAFDAHKWRLVRKVTHALLSAVAHLHTARICHKDIKPENIMVSIQEDQLVSLKLVDYNISQKAQNESFTMIAKNGTQMFMAPEMEQNQQYNHKVDIWGIGCVLCFMMHRRIPRASVDEGDQDAPTASDQP